MYDEGGLVDVEGDALDVLAVALGGEGFGGVVD